MMDLIGDNEMFTHFDTSINSDIETKSEIVDFFSKIFPDLSIRTIQYIVVWVMGRYSYTMNVFNNTYTLLSKINSGEVAFILDENNDWTLEITKVVGPSELL